jgi:hypothetical protein
MLYVQAVVVELPHYILYTLRYWASELKKKNGRQLKEEVCVTWIQSLMDPI